MPLPMMPVPVLLGAILCGMVVEGAALLAFHARTGRGPAAAHLLPNLGAGAALLLAALLAAEGAGWPGVCACLLAALVCHVLDLKARWGV